MPTFDFEQILFPKSEKTRTGDTYDRVKDLIEIKQRERAITEGGEIQNPASLDEFIQMYENMENDPSLSANQRREAKKSRLKLQQNQIKIWLAKKKKIKKSGIEWQLTQDLRDLEFASPEDPWTYTIEATNRIEDILKGTNDKVGLNDVLNTLQTHNVDTTALEKYRDVLEFDELEKFSRINRAFATGNLDSLEDYAVFYTPLGGKVGRMEVIDTNQVRREYMQKTNLKFSVAEGKLIVVPSNQKGLPIYFIKANASTGDRYNFAGSEFNFTSGIGFETKNPERFDYQKIRHATIGDVEPGKFVKNSKGQLFYVNRDMTYSPIKRDIYKDELNFKEENVYHLSPLEELNTLPGAIEHKLPLPILEKWNREAETAKFNYWQAFKEELPGATKKVLGFPESLPSKIREFHKEVMRGIEKGRAKLKPIPGEPKWEAPEIPTPTKLLEKGRAFLKKLGI